MRILFVTATRIGDAVLSTGLLAHLIERHPAARLTIAAGPAAAALFSAVPGLERLVVLDKRRWALHWLPLRRGHGPPLGSRRRSARLGPRLATLRRPAQGDGQGAGGRTPGARAGPALRSRSAAGAARLDGARPCARRRGADPGGRARPGDRAGRQLARKEMARRALRRTGGETDRRRRNPAGRTRRGVGGGA